MSGQVDPDEVVEIESDGVHVRKSFEAEDFPVPAIRFLITSERDETVSIRLAERIPEDFPMDGIGFHPDYESDNWTAYQDHHVEYTRTVEPDQSVETVYGVRIDSPEEAAQFLTEPELARVTATGEGTTADEGDGEQLSENTIDDIASEESSQAVKDMISGDDDVPGLGDDEGTADVGGDEPEIELDIEAAKEETEATGDLGEGTDADSGLGAEAESGGESGEEASTSTAETASPAIGAGEDTLVAAIAAEIESGDVPEDDLEDLRDALGVEANGGGGPGGTDMAKLEHLQKRVDDLDAYTTALEEFLNEEGSGQQIIEGFREDLEAVQSDVEAFGSELSETQNRIGSIEDSIASVEETVESVQADVADGVDDVEDELTTVQTELSSLENELSDVSDTVTDIQEWRQQLGEMFSD